jgi:hypothetical protein
MMLTIFEVVTGVWVLLALGMASLVARDSFRRFH